jgi:hypothetical protein
MIGACASADLAEEERATHDALLTGGRDHAVNATDGDGGTEPSNRFPCNGTGIAAYADALVTAAREACTSSGVGEVDKDNFACMKTAIEQVGPPHPDASFNVVKTLLAGNVDYPLYECTYFVQTVTAGVCGTPISPDGTAWTDYPLAHEFAGQTIAGYTWIVNDGTTAAEAGDIFVYGDANTGELDRDHIMIVAEVVGDSQFRIAEANELNSDGSAGDGEETGVVSSSRVATLDDPDLHGWFRRDPE